MSLIAASFTHSDPTSALQLSQSAPELLASSALSNSPLSLLSVTSSETPETWAGLERLFYACLRTGDDQSAHLSLQRLTERFGADDERVMGLRGLYQEAVANDADDLRKILEEYNRILAENPMNVPVHKRRIAIIRSLQLDQEAISTLVDFLEAFPSDAEAWCELADLYQSQGLGSQAIYCLEEALLSAPNAWNLQARLGELEYMTALSNNDGADAAQRLLIQAVRRFCRSVELCDNYLRGYYGLKVAATKLLATWSSSKGGNSENMSRETVQRLHDMATAKLSAIVKKWSKQQLPNIDQSEIIATRVLLDRTKS